MDGIAMTEMEKLKAGLAYRYDDAELVAMKDTASARCARLAAVDPLDTAERDAAARLGRRLLRRRRLVPTELHAQEQRCHKRQREHERNRFLSFREMQKNNLPLLLPWKRHLIPS